MFRKEVRPPFVPNVNRDHGLNNFEDEFKRLPAVDSIGKDSKLPGSGSPTYKGFSYADQGLAGMANLE